MSSELAALASRSWLVVGFSHGSGLFRLSQLSVVGPGASLDLAMAIVTQRQKASLRKKPATIYLSTTCVLAGMLFSLVTFFIQYAVFHYHEHQNESYHRNEVGHEVKARFTSHRGHNTHKGKAPKMEYIMWKKDDSYTKDCEVHYKNNHTWGKQHAPYVDKIEAKKIVERMRIPKLKVIPTLAVFDKQNITTEYTLSVLKRLTQPYIIKSTHVSGGVARVYNNLYHCFKYCDDERVMNLNTVAVNISKTQLLADLSLGM